jgi:regulator of sigma D
MRRPERRGLSAETVRGLLWNAYAEAWDFYQRLHDRAPDLFPYGDEVEREEIRRDALLNLRYRLEQIANELEEIER